jgi:hypothetical protein
MLAALPRLVSAQGGNFFRRQAGLLQHSSVAFHPDLEYLTSLILQCNLKLVPAVLQQIALDDDIVVRVAGLDDLVQEVVVPGANAAFYRFEDVVVVLIDDL